MSNVSTYIDYFRQIAVKHSALQHDPASETGDSAIGQKRFAVWNADEALTGLRTKVAFPALLLEIYENETHSNIQYEVHERPKGAITVVQHAQPENFPSEQAAYDTSETIMYQIWQRIWDDHYGPGVDRNTTPFREVNLNITITPVGPLFDNEFGYRAEFLFEFHENSSIAQPPAAGVFLP